MAKAQVIRCKCGKIFAGSLEPYCYTDKEWLKDISRYAKRGFVIDLVESDAFKFEDCICDKENINQLNLF